MKRRFIVATNKPTPEQTRAIHEIFDGKYSWWHWIDGFWLVTDNTDTLSGAWIRDQIFRITGNHRTLVLEASDGYTNWAGIGPENENEDMFAWIANGWNPHMGSSDETLENYTLDIEIKSLNDVLKQQVRIFVKTRRDTFPKPHGYADPRGVLVTTIELHWKGGETTQPIHIVAYWESAGTSKSYRNELQVIVNREEHSLHIPLSIFDGAREVIGLTDPLRPQQK